MRIHDKDAPLGMFPVLRNSRATKFYLLSFLVFGSLLPVSFPLQLDEQSWDSDSSVLTSQFVDDIIEQRYVSSEDEVTDGLVSKRVFDLFFVYVPRLPTLTLRNLNYETYFNSINSFHYILACGSSPLRSPPLFS
jgi:hypothetical protein